MTQHFDIIIVGGGIAGNTLACALALQTPLSIAILEKDLSFSPWDESSYDHRVSTLSLVSKRLFQVLNVWSMIQEKRLCAFHKIMVWDEVSKGEIKFDSREIAEPVLGYVIENNLIQTALKEKIKQQPQITVLSPVNLIAFRDEADSVILTASDERQFKATLVVAADGIHSWLRQQVNIDVQKTDYHQEGIVATVETVLPHENVARQVFLKTGPLAFLPLESSTLSSIVWSLPTHQARSLLHKNEVTFAHELEQAFGLRLGEVIQVGPRFSFPLFRQYATQYISSRVALVGDAAHCIHPLAGQGLNMALLDAACFAQVIAEAIKNRREFASVHTLRHYERWRKADNMGLIKGVDLLKSFFDNDNKHIQTIRSFGLNFTNRMTWIKNFFTHHAVGNRNNLPQFLWKV